jgi:hypothetical protein
MSPTVVSVKPEAGYFLTLHFSNGEVGRFDVKPYFSMYLKVIKSFDTPFLWRLLG